MAASFRAVLSAAVADFEKRGFDSKKRLEVWMERLRKSIEGSSISEAEMQRRLKRSLTAIYKRMVERGGVARETGVPRYVLARVKPKLRAELDRRIMASAELIRLNRRQTIEETLQRFAGWSTSIPKGGTKAAEAKGASADLQKPLASLSFRERRVLIDQGQKFIAALSDITAKDAGAIAGLWRSNWRQINYAYREDHKDRDGKFYVVRGSWADKDGLIRHPNGYTDQITQPAEEVFCRCAYRWVYHLRDLPRDMLTDRGRKTLASVRVNDSAVLHHTDHDEPVFGVRS